MTDTMDKTDSTDNNAANESSSPSAQPAQPEYGQISEPKYGQMASKYPDWDPYVFGREEQDKNSDQKQAKAKKQGQAASSTETGNQAQSSQQGQKGQSWFPGFTSSANGGNQGNFGNQPFFYNRRGQQIPLSEFDPNNPDLNPLYGRWSAMAIWAFILTLLNFQPMAVFLAFLAIPRTNAFHMKGKVLAILSVVIFVAELIFLFWWILSGHSVADLYAILDSFLERLRF